MKRYSLWVAFMLLSLMGCSVNEEDVDEPQETTEPITLNVLHQFNDLGTELYDVYYNAVAKYERQNPHVKINTEIVNMDAYKTKIQIEFASDAQNIDVFYYWAESKPKQLALADKILPLNDYLTQETLAKLKPESLDSFIYQDKIYAVPTFGWYLTLYCNQELFKLADAKIPETFDELLVAVEKLNRLEGVTPIVVGGRDAWDASLIFQALALGESGALQLKDQIRGETTFSEEAFLKAAKGLKQLTELSAFGDTPFSYSSADANIYFTQGSGAMRFMGSWYGNQVYHQKGNRDIIATKIPINNELYQDDYVGGFVESFFVNANTKHKEEAAKFAIYISEAIGNGAHFSGLGLSAWDSRKEPDYLNDISKQIYQHMVDAKYNVIAWDTLLPPALANIHLQQVQMLFTKEGNPDDFVKAHKDMLKKEQTKGG